jgi:hypothetical protein
MSLFRCLDCTKLSVQVRGFLFEYLVTGYVFSELLAPCPNHRMEEYTLSAIRVSLLNTFAATLHTEGRSSISNLRTRHAVVTGTHFSRNKHP